MKNRNISRRDFIKITSASAAVLAVNPGCIGKEEYSKFDPKELPTRILGSTGTRVPLIGLGCGSRFLQIDDIEESDKLLNYALDNGIFYWDTAADYDWDNKSSEERLGRVLKHRREEVWLSTKVSERDGYKALKQFERSLKRLQTDYLNELKIHAVAEDEGDIERIMAKGGVYETVQKLKEEGVAKNIGFSGHTSAEAMKRLIILGEFDTMLIAMNHFQEGNEKFEGTTIPYAAEKKIGIIAMKVVRPRETVKNISAESLIKYALSVKHVNMAILGMDSMDILKNNLKLLKDFQPLKEDEMTKIRLSLKPFFNGENVQLMNSTYRDGLWV